MIHPFNGYDPCPVRFLQIGRATQCTALAQYPISLLTVGRMRIERRLAYSNLYELTSASGAMYSVRSSELVLAIP